MAWPMAMDFPKPAPATTVVTLRSQRASSRSRTDERTMAWATVGGESLASPSLRGGLLVAMRPSSPDQVSSPFTAVLANGNPTHVRERGTMGQLRVEWTKPVAPRRP